MAIHVTNEIKTLKKVLLHRPGKELLNLTPNTLKELLFDDIPFLAEAQEEHDNFAKVLRENGVEVVYLEDLMTQTLDQNPGLREKFLKQFITEGGIYTKKYKTALFEFLNSIKDNKELILKTMEGVNLKEIDTTEKDSLVDLVSPPSKMVLAPMPNLYFTRDPFASVGDGVVLNKMYSKTRNRETIFADYIFKYHKDYKDRVEMLYNRDAPSTIEGGDILNINETTLAIGISQRTQADAISDLAKKIFYDSNSKIRTILAFDLPESRAFMHLDTVFTQIDYDKFTIHPGILGTLRVFEITRANNEDELTIREKHDTLEHILEKYLGRKVELILCGGGDEIIAAREQWNDGSNTLCISPGKIIVYSRNTVTNDILKSKGLEVLEIKGAELVRGRGGPRCMSMPLERED